LSDCDRTARIVTGGKTNRIYDVRETVSKRHSFFIEAELFGVRNISPKPARSPGARAISLFSIRSVCQLSTRQVGYVNGFYGGGKSAKPGRAIFPPRFDTMQFSGNRRSLDHIARPHRRPFSETDMISHP
jgi:hypothetical protein